MAAEKESLFGASSTAAFVAPSSTKMIGYAMPEESAVLAAVGRVAIRHGQLEDVLRMTINSPADLTPNEGRLANARTPASEMRRRIRKLARQRFGEGQSLLKIEALMQRAENLSDRRNELLHGLWGSELDGEPLILYSPAGAVPAPTAATLEALANDLHSLLAEMNHARLKGFINEALRAHPLKRSRASGGKGKGPAA